MIFIALGSNLGKREEYLAQARAALEAHDIEISSASSIIETPALMPEGAPAEWNVPYLNQVVRVRTELAPMSLLLCLKHIEQELGRAERAHWAPREIDLDLLTYNDEIIITDRLTLPHPQMDNRAFVLKPLMEIAPHWRHPVFEKTAAELLAALASSPRMRGELEGGSSSKTSAMEHRDALPLPASPACGGGDKP